MKMKCILCTLGALVMCTAPVFAQAANKQEKSEFNPHWFMQVQAGASYTLGEGPFGKLVSPAAALSAGYQFSPVWGLRFGLSGWQSKGAWVSPQTTYQYKYLQGNVEATLDLANLFGRFNPRRTVNPFLFAGVGLNGAFDNDEANALNDSGYRLGNICGPSGSRREFPLVGLCAVWGGDECQHALRQVQLEEGRQPRLAVQRAGRLHVPLRQEP